MVKLDYAFWRAPFSEVAEAVTAKAKRAGLSLPDLLREAEVSISTWKRWKNGSVAASFDKFGTIVGVLEHRINELKGPARGSKSKK